MTIRIAEICACILLALAAQLALPGSALAQEASPKEEASPQETPSSVKPWAAGVSAEAKSTALAIFEEGNGFFERSQYSQALAEYRKAVESWDHPAIRYNMAVCLINLDVPLEAHANLSKGLAFGAEPLSQGLFAEGQTYMKLLMGRLAEVTISGTDAGATVTLDGEPLFKGAGKAERLLLPGKHQLISKSEGMMTYTSELLLEPGKMTEISVKMVPLSESVVLRRRWKVWKPWAVTGAGLGVAALGGVAYLLADSNFTSFEAGVAQECPEGCNVSMLSAETRKYEERGDLESIAATSLLIAGGTVVTTGLVMMFLNRPRPVQLGDPMEAEPAAVTIVPAVGPELIGISGAFAF